MSMPSDAMQGLESFAAGYSDGLTAERHAATVHVGVSGLRIVPEHGAAIDWSFDDLRAQTQIDARAAMAVFTSATQPGATLFVQNAVAVAGLAARAPHLTTKAERWSALKPGLMVGAVALVAGLSIWLLDLSPSKAIARMMPEKARVALGEAALEGMIAGRRRCTDVSGVAALRKLHDRLQPGKSSLTAVTVVDWSLTNAFAVPGGSVVLTRAILEKASSPDEVAGVLAHELGHGQELHPEQGLVRGIGMWTAMQIMFTGSPGTLGNIGGALAQLSYSRDAEREADQRALDMLKAGGISAKPFAGFFRKMEKVEPTTTTGRMMRANDLFASHPQSAERIAKIEAVADYPSRPALSDDEWKALRGICGTKTGG
jgi:beta-barrel assembly-enhancing protease